MTDHDNQPGSGAYGGPPPMQQNPYQQPWGQPIYGQPYPPPQPYAQPYPQPGYPPAYGYPYPQGYGAPQPTGPKRPGLVIASAVLAYVNAGMIILAGAFLLFGAAIVGDLEDAVGSGTDYGTEFAIDGVFNLICGGLLIAGAVGFTGGRSVGRIMLTVGNGIVLALAVYWFVRFSGEQFNGAGDGNVVWGVIFSTLAILSLVFTFVGPVNRWMKDVAR